MSVYVVYLDTSALIKLFFDEEGSSQVRRLLISASAAATSAVAYVEARAAFARKRRLNLVTDEEYQQILQSFEREWPGYLSVEVSSKLISAAGDLAERHGLRGFDAIHLASALAARAKVESRVVFSCADERLQRSATVERLDLEA
ncbi:MAG: type II toxin-antitoxin system VapC family toxin [Chloroflexi bacterium]|nr:type II toxin-antitoxin system VapC family toxin [Chloroflexota bacterium]